MCFNLEAEGHEVDVVGNGEMALQRILSANAADTTRVILDVMLPDVTASAWRKLRREGEFVPILMLTARGRPKTSCAGFEAGADDYLPKPFELAILIARLRGLLRRSAWIAADAARAPRPNRRPEVLTFAGKTLDFGNSSCGSATRPIT